jgi:CBS domain-containing protein/sporulation protein YlmC with PRC-barrel domain
MNLPSNIPVFASIYLSDIQGAPVYSPDGSRLGTLRDLLILPQESPRVAAALVRTPQGSQLLDWEGFSVTDEDRKLRVTCRSAKPHVAGAEGLVALARQVLDQQIVDLDGRKLVRVNDIRLAFLSTGCFPVAVDVGVAGLLRRLGVVDVTNAALQVLGRSVPGRLIKWDDIGVLARDRGDVKLAVSAAKLNTLHPSDLSDIVEEMDVRTRQAVFQSLDAGQAADVLEAMEDEAQARVVEELPLEKAADVLEQMPSDEVADILDDLKQDKAEELLEEMDKETSSEVRELMEYEEGTVGSLMSADFTAFAADSTAEQALAELRRQKPEPDAIYTLFVTDTAGLLRGSLALPDLVLAPPEAPLSKLMDKRPKSVHDTDKLAALTKLISKYSLLSVPVVDKDKRLVGCIVIDDVVYRMLRSRRGRL